jgi:hypothetical protein
MKFASLITLLLGMITLMSQSVLGFIVPHAKQFSHNKEILSRAQEAATPSPRRSTTMLQASDKNSTTDTKFSFDTYIEVGEPRILQCDLVMVAVACELLGLLDVLMDPSFWQKGGLNQPIPLIPPTLGTLLQRFCGLSFAWLLAGSSWRGFQQESIATDDALIWTTASMCVTFAILRVGLEYLVAMIGTDSAVDLVDLTRQIYFSLLTLCAGRLIYSKYNR